MSFRYPQGANFRMVADFTQVSEGQITINTPFVQTLIIGGRIPKLNHDVSKPVQRTRHPIHDVIRWQKSLDEGTGGESGGFSSKTWNDPGLGDD